jgi:hypothetical protein
MAYGARYFISGPEVTLSTVRLACSKKPENVFKTAWRPEFSTFTVVDRWCYYRFGVLRGRSLYVC